MENMHGTDIFSNDKTCGWYDKKTNKKVSKDQGFEYTNLHHNEGEPKKQYIWRK